MSEPLQPTTETVRQRLRRVDDPCSVARGTGMNIVEMGLIKDISIDSGHVAVTMRLTSPGCMMVPYFCREVEAEVGELEGVDAVDLSTDAGYEWTADHMDDGAQAKRQEHLADLAQKAQSN